jgi:hypothetical protein
MMDWTIKYVTVHPKSGKLAQLRGLRPCSLRSGKSPYAQDVARATLAAPSWNGASLSWRLWSAT